VRHGPPRSSRVACGDGEAIRHPRCWKNRVGRAADLVGRLALRVEDRDGDVPGGQRKREEVMAVKLNKRAFKQARVLLDYWKVVIDERDAWSEHQPTAAQENEFIRLHGFDEYGEWFLGIDDEEGEQTKGRYKFPYGDFEKVHRCAVLAAESRAGQYKYLDIESAAAHLHGMIEQMKHEGAEKG
jgi:hypothetical protein